MLDGSTAIELMTGDADAPPSAAYCGADGDDKAISVIIPHYNDLEGLRACIAGLRRQSFPFARMEVIVADNNSACGLEAVAAVADGCRVVHAPIQGAGPARNAGVAASTCDILAFIDSDCQPSSQWVEEGMRALRDYDFVGGEVETTARDPDRPSAVEAWEMVFGFNFKRYILVEGYTGSGNMFVRRSVFEAVSGFRAGVSEDMDWSYRARRAGYRLGYAPNAAVQHLARSQWSDLVHRWRRVIAEHYLLTREKPFGALLWLGWTFGMPLSVVPHLVRVLRSNRLPGLRARVGAAAVLVLHRLWRMAYMTRVMIGAPAGYGS
jgi:GT2 family glycosyltransferase